MFTKAKLVVAALTVSLLAGVAGVAVANTDSSTPNKDRQAEREVRRAKRIAEFDTNKDGKLDATERAAMKQAMAEKRFAKMDTNGDGVISKDEFMAAQAKMGGRHHKGTHHKGGDAAKPEAQTK